MAPRRTRILMENFKWNLELGEAVPDLAPPPQLDTKLVHTNHPKLTQFLRKADKWHKSQRSLKRTRI